MAVPADATRPEIIPAGSSSFLSPEHLAGAFLASFRVKGTRDQYRQSLRSWFACAEELGVNPVYGARRHHIEAWGRILEERRGNMPATVAGRLCAVRSFFNWLEAEEILECNPGRNVAIPKVSDESRTTGLSRLEFSALFAASERSVTYHAMVCLLAFNGLRISEALALNIEEMARSRGHFLIRVIGKGNKITQEPLAPDTWFAVERAVGDRESGPILLSTRGTRLSRGAAYKAMRRLGREAGIPGRTHPHQLRHAFVTAALDAGIDLRDVAVGARHAKVETTVRYDRNRKRLDRHPTYRVAPFLRG